MAFAAAFLVLGHGLLPLGGRQGLGPPGLGLAADHAHAADLLELEAVARVEQAMPRPVAGQYADIHAASWASAESESSPLLLAKSFSRFLIGA